MFHCHYCCVCIETADPLLNALDLFGWFVIEFDRASTKHGSEPNFAGRSSSIPTNLRSQILQTTFMGTSGDATPTIIASV